MTKTWGLTFSDHPVWSISKFTVNDSQNYNEHQQRKFSDSLCLSIVLIRTLTDTVCHPNLTKNTMCLFKHLLQQLWLRRVILQLMNQCGKFAGIIRWRHFGRSLCVTWNMSYMNYRPTFAYTTVVYAKHAMTYNYRCIIKFFNFCFSSIRNLKGKFSFKSLTFSHF